MAQLIQSRVYIRRQGRMTRAQARAVETLLDRYRISSAPGSSGPPISAGKRRWLSRWVLEWAMRCWRRRSAIPIGIASASRCIGRVSARCSTQSTPRSLTNVRIIEDDARAALANLFGANALHRVMVFFPDPWPKSKHHKRRLINAEFAALVANRLAPDGQLQLATDWEHYALAMRTVLDAEPGLENLSGPEILRRAVKNARRLDSKPAACGWVISSGIWRIGGASQEFADDRIEVAQSQRRHRETVAAHQSECLLAFPLSGDRRGRKSRTRMEERLSHAIGQSQRIEQELARQRVACNNGLCAQLGRGRFEVPRRRQRLAGADHLIARWKAQLPVRAGADPDVVAKRPVVEIVARFLARATERRNLVA